MVSDEWLTNVFEQCVSHLEKKIDSLIRLRDLEETYPRKDLPGHGGGLGFEAWVKVEMSKALGKVVVGWQQSPGLVLSCEGESVELDVKTTSDANFDWIERGFISADVVFAVCNKKYLDESAVEQFKKVGDILGWQELSDGQGLWIVLLARKK